MQDPHLRFANGARADFRGLNNTLYNFLSSHELNVNVKTEFSDFMLHELRVHGSFLAEAHLSTQPAPLSIWESKLGPTNIIWAHGTDTGARVQTGPYTGRR